MQRITQIYFLSAYILKGRKVSCCACCTTKTTWLLPEVHFIKYFIWESETLRISSQKLKKISFIFNVMQQNPNTSNWEYMAKCLLSEFCFRPCNSLNNFLIVICSLTKENIQSITFCCLNRTCFTPKLLSCRNKMQGKACPVIRYLLNSKDFGWLVNWQLYAYLMACPSTFFPMLIGLS